MERVKRPAANLADGCCDRIWKQHKERTGSQAAGVGRLLKWGHPRLLEVSKSRLVRPRDRERHSSAQGANQRPNSIWMVSKEGMETLRAPHPYCLNSLCLWVTGMTLLAALYIVLTFPIVWACAWGKWKFWGIDWPGETLGQWWMELVINSMVGRIISCPCKTSMS
jgi:hypothetical protein